MAGGSGEDLHTVRVPEAFRDLFLKAQEYVGRYFSGLRRRPEDGTLKVGDERYILMRGASVSVEFFKLVASMYRERGRAEARRIARGFLFDLAHAVGRADARAFHRRMRLDTSLARLSAGPVHFAHTGWAWVDISPESHPTPDENYLLLYDHPNSFEADAWLAEGQRPDFPVCIMNAGYSSGWCEESFGLPLVAVETECRARGDGQCRFVMAPPSRIREHLTRRGVPAGDGGPSGEGPAVPEFFERRRLEEELRVERELVREAKESLEQVYRLIPCGMLTVAPDRTITSFNEIAARITGYRPEEVVGRSCDLFAMAPCNCICGLFAEGVPKPIVGVECVIRTKRGEMRIVRRNASLLHDAGGRVVGGIETFEDVTELKRLQLEALRAREMERRLETSGDGGA
jgi:PAS domain S-box-containing protein